MAPHSSTLAWKIPWMEEPGRLQSIGSLRVQYDWATSLSLSCIGEGNGNPLQCSCLENPRTGEPGGLPSMGSHRVGHDWSDLAAAAAPYLWDKYLKAGTPVQRINACVIFIDTPKFPSTGIRQICKKFPPATHEKACFPTAWPTDYVVKHSAFHQSAGWEIGYQWVLIGIFLIVGKVENLFISVRPIWILPSVTSLQSMFP